MLLDALTIFFLVAGSLLLWLNIRRQPSDVILTKLDDDDRCSIAGPSLEEMARKVAVEKAPDVRDLDMTWLPITAYAPIGRKPRLPRREVPKFKDQNGAVGFRAGQKQPSPKRIILPSGAVVEFAVVEQLHGAQISVRT